MKKKLIIVVMLVTVTVTLYAGIAHAADMPPNTMESGGRGFGVVDEVQDDHLLITLQRGTEIKLFIDERTRLHFHDGSAANFEDVQVGAWMGSSAIRISRKNWLAREILLFPENYELPENAEHVRGRVNELEPEEGGFMLNTLNGASIFVKVEADTWFLGHVQNLDKIRAGMLAGVHGYETEQGTIVAHTMWVRFPTIREAGMIRRIDIEENTLIIEKRNGDLEDASVDEKTSFRSRDDTIQELSDLEAGMAVMVQAIKLDNQSPLARQIVVFDPDHFPEFDVRIFGKVISMSLESISVETRSGDLIRFQITERTRFRGHGGTFHNIRDIDPGMWVGVGKTALDVDEIFADVILFLHR